MPERRLAPRGTLTLLIALIITRLQQARYTVRLALSM